MNVVDRLLRDTAEVRAGLVTLLGLAVFQSSQQLTTAKLGYVIIFALATFASTYRLVRLKAVNLYRRLVPLLAVSALLLVLVAFSALVARVNGIPTTLWLRDASPYLLAGFVPVLAVDAGCGRRPFLLAPMFAAVGLVASVSFSTEWLDRRHLAQLSVTKVGFPSMSLPVAALSFAVASGWFGRTRRWLWSGYALLVAALLLVTGNRTSLLAGASPLATLIVSTGHQIRRVRLVLVIVCISSISGVALALIIAQLGHVAMPYLLHRFESIPGLAAKPWADPSFAIRAAQSADALRVLRSHLILGSGPGYLYRWIDYSGSPQSSFEIDTGLAFAAKFGFVGIAVLAAYAAGFVQYVRAASSEIGLTTANAALTGFLVFAAIWAILEPPLEDKGFGLGLLFLIALSTAEWRAALPDTNTADQVSGP